jgi:hypothetical protein
MAADLALSGLVTSTMSDDLHTVGKKVCCGGMVGMAIFYPLAHEGDHWMGAV